MIGTAQAKLRWPTVRSCYVDGAVSGRSTGCENINTLGFVIYRCCVFRNSKMLPTQCLYSSQQDDSSDTSFMHSIPCHFPSRLPPTCLVQIDAASSPEASMNQPQLVPAILLCENFQMYSGMARGSTSQTTAVPLDCLLVQQPVESIDIPGRNCGQSLTSSQGWIAPSALFRTARSESTEGSVPKKGVLVSEQIEECGVNRDGTMGGATSPIGTHVDSEGPPQVTERVGKCVKRRGENVEFRGVTKHKKSGRCV